MNTAPKETIKRKYQLEREQVRVDRRSRTVEEELRQARYQKRISSAEAIEYSGSFRRFLDKFSGKQADREEQLRAEVRKAEATLYALEQEQKALQQRLPEIREELALLPSLESLLRDCAQDPEASTALYRQEALLCVEILRPLLEGNEAALLELRFLNGQRVGEIISREEREAISTAPDQWAAQCQPWLARLETALEALNIPFETGNYYRSPVMFLHGVAAAHNQRDRLNASLDEVITVKKQVAELAIRLED